MSTKLSVEQATELFKKMEMEVVVVADEEEADKAPDIDNMAKAAFSEIEAKIENEKGAELKAAGAAA
jgi:replicative DNA helicase